MSTADAEISSALTEAQALLSLVFEKLKADTLAPHELFALHVTVQVALTRIDTVHDVLHAPLLAAHLGLSQEVIQ